MTSAVHAVGGSRPEWPYGPDLAQLAGDGWRPVPFRQFVLKLHSRCNLACTYCYLYTMTDQSRRAKPKVMARAVIDQACRRIAAHASTHGLDEVEVVLHGGEPLLAGMETIGYTAESLRQHLPAAVRLGLRVQTNGLLLDEPMLRTLAAHQVHIGVSLDGDRQTHDARRQHADGRGSFDAVRAALQLLNRLHPELFAGLICTIDLRTDPVTTYEALLEFAPPAVDLLLPHGNWTNPPPGRRPADPGAPYGEWLAAVFDRWYRPAPETEIRFLREIITLAIGGWSRVESIGLSPVALLVIDTDGELEQVDTLRSAFDGASQTGLTVFTDAFDTALRHPGVVARQIGRAALSDQCLACPVHRICGGGYYPHRYLEGAGFRQPSVYCRDLRFLIDHVVARVRTDLAALVAQRS